MWANSKFKPLLKNQSGISILEVMIAIGLMGVVTYGVIEQTKRFTKTSSDTLMKNGIAGLRQNLINTIQNDSAWTNTKTKNPGVFDCLAANNCKNEETLDAQGKITITSEHPFVLYNAGGNQVLANPQGYARNGSPCNNYPSPSCPIRITLKWHTICTESGGVCGPDLSEKVRSEIEYTQTNASEKTPFNPANYQFEITRGGGPGGSSLEDVCNMFQGIFDTDTKTCQMNMMGDCNADEYVAGINPDFSKNCKTIPVCATGTIYRGIDPDGNLICEQLAYSQLDNSLMLCPLGKVFRGIKGDGTPDCVDNFSAPVTPVYCAGGASVGSTRSTLCTSPQIGSYTQTCSSSGAWTPSTPPTGACTTKSPYGWVFRKIDGNGCHSCEYRCPNQPSCTVNRIGKRYACRRPGSHNDDLVYVCVILP